MCSAITVGGQLVGYPVRIAMRASTPPVEAPIATILPSSGRQIVEGMGMLDRRFADAVDGAELHRPDRGARPSRRQARDHDDGKRPQAHDLVKKLKPVHFRHLDVERHDVGIERLDGFASLQRIGRLSDHDDFGVARQRGRNQAAHRGRIVDDEDADGRHASLPRLSR
jgi:hypothetical protein